MTYWRQPVPFKFTHLPVNDLVLVEPQVFGDARGGFAETYKYTEFVTNGVPERFVQDNWSRSAKDVLRGMHYQVYPKAQGKLMSVARGEIFDVAIDLREDSSTYLKWYGVRLSDENHLMLYVPPGFGHGFCVLSDSADVTYKVTSEYDPTLEKGFAWNDPAIAIDWPVTNPTLSGRDQQLPPWSEAKQAFAYKEPVSGRP
jgi:dTDP-4-dehydrorhamnose 3,5-epimerase